MKKGDENGLSQLYDKYASALLGVLTRILLDKGLAEETLSQTMLKAWDKIDSYNADKATLFTWLMTIARNSAIDKKRLKSFSNLQKTDSLTDHVYNVPSTDSSSFSLDLERITSLVEAKYKVVLDKIYLEGYSQSEAAKQLDLPLGTVKTRLRKAILILREELKDEKSLFFGFILLFILLKLFGS